jgi:hypothetical protein
VDERAGKSGVCAGIWNFPFASIMKTTLLPILPGDLTGKSLFVMLTFVDPAGVVLDQHQTAGTVDLLSEDGFLLLRQPDDSLFRLPLDWQAIRVASPGEYRVRRSGHRILNPDFLGQWEVAVRSQRELENYLDGGFPLSLAG